MHEFLGVNLVCTFSDVIRNVYSDISWLHMLTKMIKKKKIKKI